MSVLGFAPGRAPVALDSLISESEEVIVGSVSSGSRSGAEINLSIRVEKILKGTLRPGDTISATATTSKDEQAVATQKFGLMRGIFFLSKPASDGSRKILPPLAGYIPSEEDTFIPLPMTPSSAPVGNTPKEGVMLEILAALESGQPHPLGGFVDITGEYRKDPSTRVRAVFQRLTRNGDIRLQAMGLKALLAESDLSTLNRVATDQTLRGGSIVSEIASELRTFKSSDPNAIADLGRIVSTKSNPSEMRKSAATALARLGTEPTLSYLAPLLEEEDITFVTAAIGGLSGFANDFHVSRSEPPAGQWKYRTDETVAHGTFDERMILARRAYYIDFWRKWWQTNQGALTK